MANQQINSSLVPLTLIWDVARLNSVDVNTPEFKELLVRLYQYINSIAIALNDKDAGFYVLYEFVTGQQYFPNTDPTTTQKQQNRSVFRMTVDVGALPNTGTKSVPHNIPITDMVTTVHIYASATDPGVSFIPIPYVSTTGDDIEINLDATNVNIVTLSDRTNYTDCKVVIEYLKM